MTEQSIQRQIREWLSSIGAKATKYNANGYGEIAHPDLFVSLPRDPFPVAFYVEVKTENGVLSPTQKVKIARMKFEGHLVCVARSVADVRRFMAEKGILHR